MKTLIMVLLFVFGVVGCMLLLPRAIDQAMKDATVPGVDRAAIMEVHR